MGALDRHPLRSAEELRLAKMILGNTSPDADLLRTIIHATAIAAQYYDGEVELRIDFE
jgi:hypothetical protein